MNTESSSSLRGRHSTGVWVFLAAGWFFCLGLVGGFTAALAAAITGASCWWLFIERPSSPMYSRGILAGFLAQLTAYPVMYLLSGFLGLPGFFGNQPAFTYSGPIQPGVEIVNILEGLISLVWTFGFGMIVTGPIGVAGGLILVAVRRRSRRESEIQ
jgi:hypothetical protein